MDVLQHWFRRDSWVQYLIAHPFWSALSCLALYVLFVFATHTPYAPYPIIAHLHIFLFHPKRWYFRWLLDACIYHYPKKKTWQYGIPPMGWGWITTDPVVLKYLLVNKAKDFHKSGGEYAHTVRDLFGDGLLLAKGEPWRAQRQAGQVFATAETLNWVSNIGLPKNIPAVLLDPLDKAAENGDTVDFEELAGDLTISVFGEIAFDTDAKRLLEISKPFDNAIETMSTRWTNPFWQITEGLTKKGKQARRDIQIVREFSRRMVRETFEEFEREETGKDRVSDLKEEKEELSQHDPNTPFFGRGRFIRELLNTGYKMSEDLIADCCLNYLLAGRDTTSNGMNWTLYYLMTNPSCLAKCMTEIDDLPPNTPNLDIANLCPYFEACINESLRLSPPAPMELVENNSKEPVILPGSDGIIIKPGQDVVFGAYINGRLPWVWGEDAEEYKPERWLAAGNKDQMDPRKLSAYETLTFHAGTRACLGQKLARLEIVAALKAVLERYELSPGDGWDGGKREMQEGMTNPMIGGLPIRAKRRIR